MKCAVVQDLLPIYCDGVCSPETSVEIKKHTENCPVCSSLLKDYKSEVRASETKEELPQKPFKKIKAKIFRSKLVIILLAIVLLALISTVCYLGYGQVIKEYGHPSFETIISSFGTKKLMEKLCEGDIDYVMDRITVRDRNLFYYDGYLVPDEYIETCRENLEKYYNMIKDKETNIKMDGCTYDETLNGLKFVDCFFSINTDGLPVVRFEIFDVGEKYIISCFMSGAYDQTDEFCSFIERMNFVLDPIITYDYKFEMHTINAEDTPKDIYMTRYRIMSERYSDRDFYNEAYSTALLERMFEMNQSGIYCDDFNIVNTRFDKESKRFLAEINAVFTDPVTGNKIVYIRTIQWIAISRRTILDEFEPTIIDGGVCEETLKMITNLF